MFADHGGFDVAFEVAEAMLAASVTGAFAVPLPPPREVTTAGIRLRVVVDAVTPGGADVLVGEQIVVTGTFHAVGTVLSASVGGVQITLPPGLAGVELAGTFTVPFGVGVGVRSGSRGVVLTPDAAHAGAVLDHDALFASPPIQIALAAAYLQGGETAYQQKHTEIGDAADSAAAAAIADATAGLTPQLALPEPAGVTFAAVRTSVAALKVLVSLPGSPAGNPSAAGRVIVRSDALGAPLDLAAAVLNNGTVLRAVRAGLATTLGIPVGSPAWSTAHPCAIFTPTPFPVPPGTIPMIGTTPAATVSLDFLLGQVNAAGLLQVDARLTVSGFGGFASGTASATITAPFTATVSGGVLTIGVGPSLPAVATSDVQVNPLAYVLAALAGQFSVIAVLAAVDLIAGPFVAPIIAGALTGLTFGAGFALPLSGRFSSLSLSTPISAVEPTAPLRSVTIPIPGASITITLDRVQDVTVRLA
ncbi:hypothetical protein [Cellulomonas sp. ICMP 17802]|uniref:hypothetical protein n=1 Tax=Cellulomonas sp. ICMP 17802 TaxID=3239199 RepID=UPI00351B57DB